MRFQILGPMHVEMDGREIPITASRDRALLTTLLMYANQPVHTDRLIDAIWDADPPQNARNQLQGCVSRLRKRLGERFIVTEPAGYRIAVEPGEVDLLEFRRLVAQARTEAGTGRYTAAGASFRTALALWRGPAVAGFESQELNQVAAALEEERAHALQARFDADLSAGGGSELVAELAVLVRQHPHREGLHRALMLALYRAGRQADSLAAYRHARQVFNDELGTEPGTELQQLHRAILNRDPALDGQPSPGQPPAPPSLPKPRELPADVAGFTGRIDTLRTLDELLADRITSSGPLIITAIAGTAGVGKTALAVHWAHRVADRFPDGQLYVNLRGYATGNPLTPIEALSMLLRSLGLPPDQVPAEEAEASARYRSVLADRRVLIVLDNARSVHQVRPLLPGSPGCLILVTSRDRLAGLVARDGALRLTLDVLSAQEAFALLTHLLGEERVGADPRAAAKLAEACGCLPLALRIAAALLDEHPHRPLAALATDLTSSRRLDALEVPGDQESAMRATFDLSYQNLPAPAQRMFRLLGLIPGPDFTAEAAAALAGQPVGEAQRHLDNLSSAYLVGERGLGRYAFHDLLRLYARDRSTDEDNEDSRRAAMTRVLDWYLHNARAARALVHPTAARLPDPNPPIPQFVPEPFGSDRTRALAWLDGELANLVAAVRHADERGPRSLAWLLADALRTYLWSGSHVVDGLAIGHAALSAATADRATAGKAAAELTLAAAHERLGDREQAHRYTLRAIADAARAGWREGEASATNWAATTCRMTGRLDEASRHVSRALAINRELGRRGAMGTNLATLAIVRTELGDLAASVRYHSEALTISRDTGNRLLEATELSSLGAAHVLTGNLSRALDCLSEALSLVSELDDPTLETMILCNTATAHLEAGRHSAALDLANTALSISRSIDDRPQVSYALNVIGRVRSHLGEHEEALSLFCEVLDLVPDDIPFHRVELLVDMAVAQSRLGRLASASDTLAGALATSGERGYKMREGQAMTALASVRLSQADLAEARTYADRALRSHEETGHRPGKAHALAVRGNVAHAAGDMTSAVSYWRAAQALFEDMGIPVPAEVVQGLQQA